MKKLITIFLAIVLMFTMTVPVGATEAIGKVDDFSGYIENKDNYYLDVVKPGITEFDVKIANGIANGIFGFELRMVDLTCTMLYYVSTIDFMSIAGSKVNGVQKSLYDNLFTKSFNFAFLFVGLFLAWLLLGRKYGEILNQFAKVLLVCCMAALLGTNTAWLIGMDESITASFSNYVAAAMSSNSGEYTSSGYAVTVASQIWKTQIHEPWKTLEFGEYMPSDTLVKDLLSTPKKSEGRQDIIKSHYDSSGEIAFNKDMPGERIVFSVIYLIPLTIKNFIVCAIVLLQLAFRVVKIFLYFLGIPIMILALIPQLGGTRLIGSWFKKIVEMTIMIVILSFMLSVILWFDDILWTYAAQMGWLLVIFLQVGVAVVVFLFRNKILGVMDTVQNTVRYPAIASMKIRNKMDSMGNVSAGAQRLDERATQAVKSSRVYQGTKQVMQNWSAGVGSTIGDILPEGNVFQNASESADRTKSNTRQAANERATVRNGENRAAANAQQDNRPKLEPTAADALKYDTNQTATAQEKERPRLELYTNPDFVRDGEKEQKPQSRTVAQEISGHGMEAKPDVVLKNHDPAGYESDKEPEGLNAEVERNERPTLNVSRSTDHETEAMPGEVLRYSETANTGQGRSDTTGQAEAAAQIRPKLESDTLKVEPEKSGKTEKAKSAEVPQKRPVRQASPEMSNYPASENNGRAGATGAGTADDIGQGQRTFRETEKTRTVKKRPVLDAKPEPAAKPVNSRDIVQDRKPEKLEKGA